MADGLLSNVLNAIDQQKRDTAASLGLLFTDPQAWLANANDRLNAYNQTQLAAIPAERNELRGIPLTKEQQLAKQYADQQMQDLALGFAGNIRPTNKFINEAHKLASINAEKMLGLPPGNTALDRAKAMGFDMEGFHATGADFTKIDPKIVAKSDYGTIGQGFYIDPSKNAAYSNLVANINQKKSPQNIMPVRFKSENLYDMTNMIGPTSVEGSKRLTDNMKNAGFSGTFTYSPNGSINEVAIFDPSIVRSRFAAFDPARVNESDLLAGVVPLGLIAGQDQIELKKEKKQKK